MAAAAAADQRQITRSSWAMVLNVLAVLDCGLAASTYTVGDASGWSPGFNHLTWEQKYSFADGDTIIFNYNPALHSVQRVSELDFQSCNVASAPLQVYNSGRDAVIITGDSAFFICGTPGHCQLGMKVAIIINNNNNNNNTPAPASNSTFITPPAISYNPASGSSSAGGSSNPDYSHAVSVLMSGSTTSTFLPILAAVAVLLL